MHSKKTLLLILLFFFLLLLGFVACIHGILEGRRRLLVDRVLVSIPFGHESLVVELGIFSPIMENGEELPDKEEHEAEDDDARDDTEDNGQHRHWRGTFLVPLHPDSRVVLRFIVVIEIVEGAVVSGIHELAGRRVV